MLEDRLELLALGLVDEVVVVRALDGAVRRDDDHLEVVDLHELGGLGVGRTGHASELLVEAEVVLERDGRERAALALDRNALLGLDGLVQAVRPPTSRERAARELVDDDDLLIGRHEVVLIALVERVRAQRLLEDVDRLEVREIEEVGDRDDLPIEEHLLCDLDALVGHRDLVVLLVEDVVLVLAELRHQLRDL